jgi:two-component system, NtrC family, nitrogen regulation sensor histidine kinase NtrY
MKKNINKRIFFAAIVFLFFIALNFFYKEYVISIKLKKETVIKKVEQQIQRKEKIAEKVLNKLIQDSTSKNPEEIFLNENILKISEKELITFLEYKNDTLVFWTDNIFSSPVLLEKNLPDNRIVKTDNGWYYLIRKEANTKKCFAAILIKNEYKYENDYLANNFTRDIRLDIEGIGISENTQVDVIKNSENQKLFSLTFKPKINQTPAEQIVMLLIYFSAFFSLIFLLYQVFMHFCKKKRFGKASCIAAFVSALVIIRGFFFYFKIPADIYSTDFFGPLFYASSGLLPSFGDLLINTILFFIIAVFIYKNGPYEIGRIRKTWSKIFFLLIIITFLAALFMFIVSLIQSIILDSTISYNLSQLFSINGLSIIGLLIISLLVLSYFLVAVVLLQIGIKLNLNISYSLVFIFINELFFATENLFGLISCLPAAICFVLFCLLYFLSRKKRDVFHYYEILAYLIIFTFTVYYTFNLSNKSKELERRKSLAHKLSTGEDPLAENIYKDVQKQIAEDNLLKMKLAEYPRSELDIKEYLTKKYFSGYWDKYKVQITVCNALDSLLVEAGPQKQNCKLFFDDLLNSYGKPASCANLYVLNYGTGGNNYLSRLDFLIDSLRIYLFIELNSKFIPKGLGYPELLIDKKLFIDTDLSNYSYAKYYKNGLIDAYGKYYYSTNYTINDSLLMNNFYIYNGNGYNHLCYKSDKSSIIIISKKNGNILDIIAPFSILFIFFSIVILIFCLFEILLPNLRTIRFDFKNRLQISMVSIILVSFLIIGVATFYFIRNLNENKNLDLLSEKSMSILLELQSKIGDNDTLDEEKLAILNSSLIKFSNVFFTDINVFDTKGKLVSSSRPQIFNEGLMSGRINPRAYYQLLTQKKTLFIHKENIGKLKYYSAYALFYGRSSKILYYINLPYFAKEGELKRELSSFLTAFINIYVILIAITILIALFISGRITQPLNVIREKLRSIKLGKKNEKIVWTRRDEIGGLISEYNRMIDELAASAEILSRSEREGAWRVMAMQVAHEIKNPLTPMKLSVQHLERSWKDNAPDWGEKLERFTKNIIEQIENLAAIASEFSYFAQMPKPQNERINITNLVANSISIFMTGTGVKILFEKEKAPKDCVVFADKKQLIRVMNNILTNAIQAIGTKKNGLIEIGIEKKEHHAIISIKDNGVGISEEMKPKMFTPNFSTKSEGMGLGLAIVKGIIENSNGRIWFESEHEIGTTFFIELPLAEEDSEKR